MIFESFTIAPKGRTKYGDYISASNVTNAVSKTVYGGDTSTTDLAGDEVGGGDDADRSFHLFLSKTSNSFEGMLIALSAQTDATNVIGYRGEDRVPTYVMDIERVSGGTEEEPEIVYPANYGIQNLPGSGMTVNVLNNGTSATTVTITIDNTISEQSGTILIPAYVYLSDHNDMGDSIAAWIANSGDCKMMWLEYQWSVIGAADNAYVLDLTNDSASINCNSEGVIYSGAVQYLSCQAILYYGNEELTSGVTYDITTDVPATGVSIGAASGVLQFGNNFMFEGSVLKISVVAIYNLNHRTKVMTIRKNYPGADGNSVSRWIVTNASAIKVDPNNGTIVPTGITATVMMQVNDREPEADTGTTAYWGWDTDRPMTAYTGVIVAVAAYDYLAIGLKNSGGTFYELETIPVLEEGLNGSSGESVYRLDLTNEFAGINCDSGGTILPGAVRPECTASLYYGSTKVNNAAYSFDQNYGTGITINSSTGVITVGTGFTWTGTTIGVVINAKVSNILRGTATFTISKNYPGANGEPAVTYWLSPSANAIHVTSGGTADPSQITCDAYKQVGGDQPVKLTSAQTPYIYSGYTTTPTSRYRNGSTVNVDTSKNYICFRLTGNSVQYDIEMVPILRDGANGEGSQGRQGAAIRGPVEWTSTSARRWCSGNGNASGSSLEEDYMFMDVIFRMVPSGNTTVKKYYVCNTSYTQPNNASWNSVSQYWTETDQQYEFVASRVLLAENASIDFMTGNEIYLRDSGGTVTAGAAGGNGISFWAGSDQPGSANFQVDYQGNIKAKSGTFSGYIQMPYTFISDLNYMASSVFSSEGGYCYKADDRAYLICDGNNMAGDNTTGTSMNSFTNMLLPQPTAALQGFTYDIIVEQDTERSRDYAPKDICLRVSGNSDILCYAFLTNLNRTPARKVKLNGGRYVITCMPTRRRVSNQLVTSYQWAIIMATGRMDLTNSGGTTLYLSSVVGSTYQDRSHVLGQIITYPSGGAQPTVPNALQNNTMLVTGPAT